MVTVPLPLTSGCPVPHGGESWELQEQADRSFLSHSRAWLSFDSGQMAFSTYLEFTVLPDKT